MVAAEQQSSGRWQAPAALLAYMLLLHAVWYGILPSRQLQQPLPASSPPKSVAAAQAWDSMAPAPSTPTTTSAWDAMAVLVEPHGYELQEHFVTTPDGFILRMFRIPGRWQCGLEAAGKPVAFLQHALMDSSAGWLLLGPGRALALQLADAGFDVWLGNARGNRFSRNHTTLQPDQPAFWTWSWQQQAEFDLPASIGYVLAATQQQHCVYIGFSQGTMTALAALSAQPQLAAAVSVGILLAPVAFTTAMTSPSFVLSSMLGLDKYGRRNGWMEWGSHQPYWGRVCGRMPQLCLHFLTSFCGRNPNGNNIQPSLISTIFQYLPAGTSVQVMSHWAQGIRRRDSALLYAFDFGTDCSSVSSTTALEQPASLLLKNSSSATHANASGDSRSLRCNEQVYGQDVPPAYNMSAITTPLALFSGGQDTISTLRDVELLKQQLAPGVLQVHEHLSDYGHLDFELGSDAPDVLYPHILQLARKHSCMS